jgi:hypothetical protein
VPARERGAAAHAASGHPWSAHRPDRRGSNDEHHPLRALGSRRQNELTPRARSVAQALLQSTAHRLRAKNSGNGIRHRRASSRLSLARRCVLMRDRHPSPGGARGEKLR